MLPNTHPNSSVDAELDDLIRQTLEEEERDLFERAREPSFAALIYEPFVRSRLWFVNVASIVFGILLMVVGGYCAWNFYQAEELRPMLLWGAGLFYCLLIIFGGKVWYWLEFERIAMVREIKRVELRIAQLQLELRTVRGVPEED